MILFILPFAIWSFFPLTRAFTFTTKSMSNALIEPLLLGILTGVTSLLCGTLLMRYFSKKQNNIIKIILPCIIAIIIAMFLPALPE